MSAAREVGLRQASVCCCVGDGPTSRHACWINVVAQDHCAMQLEEDRYLHQMAHQLLCLQV